MSVCLSNLFATMVAHGQTESSTSMDVADDNAFVPLKAMPLHVCIHKEARYRQAEKQQEAGEITDSSCTCASMMHSAVAVLQASDEDKWNRGRQRTARCGGREAK